MAFGSRNFHSPCGLSTQKIKPKSKIQIPENPSKNKETKKLDSKNISQKIFYSLHHNFFVSCTPEKRHNIKIDL